MGKSETPETKTPCKAHRTHIRIFALVSFAFIFPILDTLSDDPAYADPPAPVGPAAPFFFLATKGTIFIVSWRAAGTARENR
jgi:hypothetical protein